MLKNTLKRAVAIAMALLIVVPLSINASDVPEIVIPEVDIDGAPVVIIDDISELPESMKRNIEICRNKEQNREEDNRTSEGLLSPLNITPMDLSATPMIIGLYQCPQDYDNYCGYASIQSVLNYHEINKTQTEIAEDAYYDDQALAWFIGTQANAADWEFYPAAVYLSSVLSHDFRPYNSYFGQFNEEVLSDMMFDNIVNVQEPILVCGISSSDMDDASHLPGYPATNIGHWIVAYKMTWDIDNQIATEVTYRDPAKSEAVSWSANIEATETVSLEKMFAFSSGHGIIY